MEKNVRLVVLEHLGNQLDVHILDVYFLSNWSIRNLQQRRRNIHSSYLKVLVQKHDSFIEFLLFSSQWLLPLAWLLLPTTLVMMRESSRFCWCSWGLSCHSVNTKALEGVITFAHHGVHLMILLSSRDTWRVDKCGKKVAECSPRDGLRISSFRLLEALWP